tara:strand:+ start:76 stop:417 length:342 start_codon:yes stop_codon:yes gene_type:complete
MKYLYFMEQTDGDFSASGDAVCYPAASFQGFDTPSNTTLDLYFGGVLSSDGGGDNDKITLTVTQNKHKDLMNLIVREINSGGGDSFIVVADDSNSVYLDADITACAIAITAGS